NVKVNDDPGTAQQRDPAIAVDGNGNAHAVWADYREGNSDIYYAYRPAGGAWGANVKVNDDGAASQHVPAIAVDGNGNAHAVWVDSREGNYDVNYDVYYAYRPAGGTWGANVKVNDDPGTATQYSPAIAVDGNGNAHAVWVDEREGNYDVYYAYHPAGGAWGANVKVNDDPGTALQYFPAIAVDGNGNAYVVWHDQRFGAWRVYFAHSLPTSEYRSAGTYTSPVLDTRMITAAWESLAHVSTVPAGASLAFETRSRASGEDVWSDWEQTSKVWETLEVSRVSSPRGRYLQYRVAFSSTFTGTTPVLERVQVVYRWAGAPSAPRFSTPCGITNQTTPTLRGSAAEGSVVHLYVDGAEVAIQTVRGGTLSFGAFAFAPRLGAGTHTITAAAENEDGIGPASPPLSLTVSPALPYDPINVRAGQWFGVSWLLSVPRDVDGCADPTNSWRVWPRVNRQFRVQVPVSYTTSAAVTVTVGTQTITLTEESAGLLFTGVFQPPIRAGAFIIQVNADGETTTVTGGPVLIDPDGVVYEASGSISDTIAGVTVTCYYSDTYRGQWVAWDAWSYAQVNPQVTLDDGYYSFYTPRGTYRVVAEKAGYPTYTSPDLVVVSIPVRHNVPLGYRRVYLPLVLRNLQGTRQVGVNTFRPGNTSRRQARPVFDSPRLRGR
ncbi:MAG: Ig-like domain-containing protein, partial [Anaerolineae bacterium]